MSEFSPSSITANGILEHVWRFADIGPREDGTVADHQATEYIVQTLESLQLEVKRESVPCWVMEPIEAALTLTKPYEEEIECCHGNLSGLTDSAGVKAELVFVNKAFEDDFEGREVSGKIALSWQERYWERGDQPRSKMKRAAEHGAVGIIFVTPRGDDLITCWGLGREPGPIPFVSISYSDFQSLRDKMQSGPVEVQLKVIGEPKEGESENIWALIPGTELPDEAIGLGSCHHETVPLCPGANDNGSGLAWLLELARFFNDHRQKRSVLVFVNGGEEGGLWGAQAFVDDHRDWLLRSVKAMIMVDQIGGMDPMVYAKGTRWLERMWIDEAEKLGHRLPHCFDPYILPSQGSLGDALPFVEAGIPTAITGAYPSDFFYHTTEDKIDKVCANGVKMLATSAAKLVMRLASE